MIRVHIYFSLLLSLELLSNAFGSFHADLLLFSTANSYLIQRPFPHLPPVPFPHPYWNLKITQVTIVLGYACDSGIINSVPGLEINYMVTLKSTSIFATLPLTSVVSYCSLSWLHPPPASPLVGIHFRCGNILVSQVIDYLPLHFAPITHGCHFASSHCSVDVAGDLLGASIAFTLSTNSEYSFLWPQLPTLYLPAGWSCPWPFSLPWFLPSFSPSRMPGFSQSHLFLNLAQHSCQCFCTISIHCIYLSH